MFYLYFSFLPVFDSDFRADRGEGLRFTRLMYPLPRVDDRAEASRLDISEIALASCNSDWFS